MSTTAGVKEPIRSTIPACLDRLGWSKFQTCMVAGLGAAWILDGLQITIASSVTGVLASPDTLNMTSTEMADRLGPPGRPGDRRAGLRPAVGPPGAAAAGHDAAAISAGHRGRRLQ